jgi:glycosyltransferase involved in cell wall biosynthesis
MVSVLILTLNEEQNLLRCLEAVGWSDDVLVLDSFSADRTAQVAGDHGIRLLQSRFDSFAEQRNFGLEQGGLKHEWVLHLDADEVVPPELKEEIESVIQAGEFDAFRVASKLVFEERWLRFAGMYPSYQVRLGKRDKLRFKMVGHGQREATAPNVVGTLKNPLLHYSFSKGLDDWFVRHNRYSTAEAQEAVQSPVSSMDGVRKLFSLNPTERRRALKQVANYMPCRPQLRFLYMYFLRLGFLDGPTGYRYCRLLAIYEEMILLKKRELLKQRAAKISVQSQHAKGGKIGNE